MGERRKYFSWIEELPSYRSGATLSLLTRGMNMFSVKSNENHNFYELAAKEGDLQNFLV